MLQRPPTRRPTAVIAVLGFCGGLVSITQTVALPLLPELREQLNVSVGDVSWVATASMLTGAVCNPVLGRLGDMYGKRRVMLGALVALMVGSLVSAMSTALLPLIAGRAIQGIGIAVIPLGMSVAKDVLPPERRSHGVALVSAMLGVGGGIGLPMAGVLTGVAGWQSVFWVSTALAIVGLVAAYALIPDTPGYRSGRFDSVGAIGLSVVLVSLLLPLSKAASWGFTSSVPLTLYAIAAVGAIAWYRYEHRPARPLVNVRLMRERPLMLVNAAGVLLGFGMFNSMFTAITLLQVPETVPHGFGASIVVAGFVLLPSAFAMMLMSPVSARLTNRYGSHRSLLIGALVIGGGFAIWPWLLGSLLTIGLAVCVINAGVGIAYGALPAVIMDNVPEDEVASANAIGTLTRAGGASLSSAAVAAIMGSLTTSVAGVEVPSLGAFQLSLGISALAAFGAATCAYRLGQPAPVREPALVH